VKQLELERRGCSGLEVTLVRQERGSVMVDQESMAGAGKEAQLLMIHVSEFSMKAST